MIGATDLAATLRTKSKVSMSTVTKKICGMREQEETEDYMRSSASSHEPTIPLAGQLMAGHEKLAIMSRFCRIEEPNGVTVHHQM